MAYNEMTGSYDTDCDRYKAAVERGEMSPDQVPDECQAALVGSVVGSGLKLAGSALARRGLSPAPLAAVGLLASATGLLD